MMGEPQRGAVLLPPEYRLEGGADVWRHWTKRAALVSRLTRRHLAERYRGSALGFLWSLLNPALMMVVYSFVFRFLIRGRIPGVRYEAFFLTGYLAWNFFAVAAMNAASAVLDNRHLIQKTHIPHSALPLSAVFSNLVNYLATLPLLVLFNGFFGVWPGFSILWLPAALALLLALAVGVGLLMAAVAPFFRDLLQVMGILFTAWFFATPILYHLQYQLGAVLSPSQMLCYKMNPTVGAIRFIHAVFLHEPLPWGEIGLAAAGAACLLALGAWAFRRLSPRFFEVL